jgi:hypothetical protein
MPQERVSGSLLHFFSKYDNLPIMAKTKEKPPIKALKRKPSKPTLRKTKCQNVF